MDTTKIKLWGGCPSIKLKRKEMEKSGFKVGDNLKMIVSNGSIILKRNSPKNLDELFDNKVESYDFGETNWGKNEGNETW